MNELRNYTRETVVKEITQWCAMKQKKGVRQNQQNQQKSISTEQKSGLQRSNSQPLQVKKQGSET